MPLPYAADRAEARAVVATIRVYYACDMNHDVERRAPVYALAWVVMVGLVAAVAPLSAQTSNAGSAPIQRMLESIAGAAGDSLPGAVSRASGSGPISVSVESVQVDGSRPRVADLLSALVLDSLLSVSDQLDREVAVQTEGETDMVVTINGTVGAEQVTFVVQVVGETGRVLASARVNQELSPAISDALESAETFAADGDDRDDVPDSSNRAREIEVDSTAGDVELRRSGDNTGSSEGAGWGAGARRVHHRADRHVHRDLRSGRLGRTIDGKR
jgi:hypothetical protein